MKENSPKARRTQDNDLRCRKLIFAIFRDYALWVGYDFLQRRPYINKIFQSTGTKVRAEVLKALNDVSKTADMLAKQPQIARIIRLRVEGHLTDTFTDKLNRPINDEFKLLVKVEEELTKTKGEPPSQEVLFEEIGRRWVQKKRLTETAKTDYIEIGAKVYNEAERISFINENNPSDEEADSPYQRILDAEDYNSWVKQEERKRKDPLGPYLIGISEKDLMILDALEHEDPWEELEKLREENIKHYQWSRWRDDTLRNIRVLVLTKKPEANSIYQEAKKYVGDHKLALLVMAIVDVETNFKVGKKRKKDGIGWMGIPRDYLVANLRVEGMTPSDKLLEDKSLEYGCKYLLELIEKHPNDISSAVAEYGFGTEGPKQLQDERGGHSGGDNVVLPYVEKVLDVWKLYSGPIRFQ